jgi:hypothetical protein
MKEIELSVGERLLVKAGPDGLEGAIGELQAEGHRRIDVYLLLELEQWVCVSHMDRHSGPSPLTEFEKWREFNQHGQAKGPTPYLAVRNRLELVRSGKALSD